MKKLVRFMAAVLALGMLAQLPAAQAETTLKLNWVSNLPEGFEESHPDVTFTHDKKNFSGEGEMTTSMLLGTFDYDVFELDSLSVDYHTVMEKGYCMDLSASEPIREAVENLYPVFARECMADGKIYALPKRVQFDYLTWNAARVAESGIGDVPVPTSFPEFLDFVEKWVDYIQEEPTDVILCGLGFWDEQIYERLNGYIGRLTDMLLDNHILQKSYAGEPLRFNEPELLALLKRCYELGEQLNEYDQAIVNPDCYKSILDNATSPFFNNADNEFLSLRLNENQPNLVNCALMLTAVNARTENPELCLEIMEGLARQTELTDKLNNQEFQVQRALLFKGVEPLPNPRYEDDIATWDRMIQETKDALADPDLDAIDRPELEEQLEMQQTNRQRDIDDPDNKYIVPPAQLDRYHSYVDYIFVPMPSIFNYTNKEQFGLFEQLKSRFSAGQMSAEELVSELDRIAQMIERENM